MSEGPKYTPVFAGTSDHGETIVLYKERDNESQLHILLPNEELHALSPGSKVHMRFELDTQLFYLLINSPEWSGTAKGSKAELLAAEPR